jgi:hypothetical protein
MQKKYLATALCLLAIPALAQTVEQDGPKDKYSFNTQRAQATFLAYHMAMEAEEQCNKVSFSADDLMAMDKAAAAEMVSVSPQVSMGAARLLNLTQQADDDMDSLIAREGCNGQKVKESLKFYDERLANVHPVPEQPLPGEKAATAAADTTPATPADTMESTPAAQTTGDTTGAAPAGSFPAAPADTNTAPTSLVPSAPQP